MHYQIKLLDKSNIFTIIPLLKLLNPTLSEELIDARLKEMMQVNYICVGAYNQEDLVGISGLWILHKMYSGKHIEPDNVIIHPAYRDKKIGELMMDWIHNYGSENNCLTSELNCFVSNEKGIRFWIKRGYDIIGFHMIKKL